VRDILLKDNVKVLVINMNFEEMKNYLEKKMRMSHIYQPVMIKTLLESNNQTTVDRIAKKFNEKDESNLELFRETVKRMPGKVLRQNGIVEIIEGKYRLKINDLAPDQKNKLLEICDKKIKEYEDRRGLKAIWDYKSNPSRIISGTLQYDVIQRAKRACEACGATDKKLHVDHIIPVSHGGETEIGNLQALCYTCNTQKGNRDDTDFRVWKTKYQERDKRCIFCQLESKAIQSNSMAFSIKDRFPVTKNHTLILPRRHVSSFFDLTPAERNQCYVLLDEMKTKILKNNKEVTGFNVGINVGEDSGQTVFHCHIHLIPRRKGDVNDPSGGIRNIIPGKGKWETKNSDI